MQHSPFRFVLRLRPLLFAPMMLAACAEAERAPESVELPNASDAERAVYDATLAFMAADTTNFVAFPVVLVSLTQAPDNGVGSDTPPPPSIGRDLMDLSVETWSDFTRRNSEMAEITTALPTPSVLGLVKGDSLEPIFSTPLTDAWPTFRSRHAGASGFATVSRVGFAPDTTSALVFATVSCGSLCGYGQYVHLRRDGDSWEVVGTSITWIT